MFSLGGRPVIALLVNPVMPTAVTEGNHDEVFVDLRELTTCSIRMPAVFNIL
jgi:hypothetical protein